MTAEEDPLVNLAAAVADGLPVDWDVAQSSARSVHDLEAIGELQILADIAQLHREAGSPDTNVWLSASATAGSRSASPASRDDAPPWGPLRVLERLGSGAFGDVYRAWDTSLDREVALKLLRKQAQGASADLIAREGQLLARMHHANVMSIYGAQIIDGQVGIWGEFLRGRTLAQMIAESGPLSAEETLVFADAICRALAAAHRAGLLHRDVKAQNVIREKGGRIVLMDFGLGRELQTEEAAEFELAGTPLYLAPELLSGSRASVQSDIYSLGVLMFFLVTGTFPVSGKKLEEIAANHASGQRQRLSDLRPELPTSFIQVVERALEPEPARRFESSGAMQTAVAAATRPLHTPTQAAPSPLSLSRPVVIAALALIIAGVIAVTAWLMVRFRPIPVVPSIVFSVQPPPHTRFSDSLWNVPAISPDGQYLAVVASDEASGNRQLWLHSLRSNIAVAVPESRRAFSPFWAPDGTGIGFFTPEGLKRISVGGVRADTVASASEPRGATWSSKGVLLYARDPSSGLFQVPLVSPGAAPALVISPDPRRGELGYMWPQFLPDGERFIFFVLSNDDQVRGIYLGSLNGPGRTRLVASDASGVVSGRDLLFVRDGALAVQHFNPSLGRVEGEARRLVDRVGVTFDRQSVITVSPAGGLVYSPPDVTELKRYTRNGRLTGRIDTGVARYRSPVLSRDDRYLAIQRYREALSEIVVFDLTRGGTAAVIERGTSAPSGSSPDTQFAVWGPRGDDRLVYTSGDNGRLDLYIRRIGSSEPSRLLLRSDADKMPTDWSADGRFLAYTEFSSDGEYHGWILPMEGGQRPYRLVNEPLGDGSIRFSPSGNKIAYVRHDPEGTDVWIRSFPDGKTETKVSIGGGLDPGWLSDKELSFLTRSADLTIAQLPNGRTPIAPTLAFATGVVTPGAARNNYAWFANGEEILINEAIVDATHSRVIVMTDWLSRLSQGNRPE